MKVLFILPGAGDSFYCGNCFRDNLQALALRKAGHDVVIMLACEGEKKRPLQEVLQGPLMGT